jgi:hypothetical protein
VGAVEAFGLPRLAFGARRIGDSKRSRDFSLVRQPPGPEPGGIASPRSVVPEAHDRPDPALGYVHNDRPVPGARGRAPSPRRVPFTQLPYVDANRQLPDARASYSQKRRPALKARKRWAVCRKGVQSLRFRGTVTYRRITTFDNRICGAFSIPNPLCGCFSDLAQYSALPHSITPRGPDSRTRTRTKRLMSAGRPFAPIPRPQRLSLEAKVFPALRPSNRSHADTPNAERHCGLRTARYRS